MFVIFFVDYYYDQQEAHQPPVDKGNAHYTFRHKLVKTSFAPEMILLLMGVDEIDLHQRLVPEVLPFP